MILDIHTHVADLRSHTALDRMPVTYQNLLARLDEEGIDKAVVLPLWINPEGIQFPFLFTPQVDLIGQIRACAQYPDRLIPFGNVDPRMGGNTARTDFSWLFGQFVDMGCVGIGEITSHLEADDPRVVNLFRQCGQWQLPVIIHVTGSGEGHYGLIDMVGSPRLERLLQQVPDTVVIGHGPGFWAEVDGDLTVAAKSLYPQGPIAKEGSLPRLLRAYPNLYADISAHSGHNALTRDETFGVHFLNGFQEKILFGTDVCFGDLQGRMPHLEYLHGLLTAGEIGHEVFEKITWRNALRVLKRYHSFV